MSKSSVLDGSPDIDEIAFHYEDQTDFSQQPANQTSFDCEAFIIKGDSIYLFSKDWINEVSCIYSIPKVPGEHTAIKHDCYNVNGLITGSVYLEDKNLIVLCAYTATLQPFIYLLYDFEGTDFFGGNKRRISLDLPFHQIEAIESQDGLTYYLTNEYFSHAVITVPQAFHIISLEDYISHWLNQQLIIKHGQSSLNIDIFPNPGYEINVGIKLLTETNLIFEFFDMVGRLVYEYNAGFLHAGDHSFSFDRQSVGKGSFLMKISADNEIISRKIVLE